MFPRLSYFALAPALALLAALGVAPAAVGQTAVAPALTAPTETLDAVPNGPMASPASVAHTDSDTKFSIVVFPDTQQEVVWGTDKRLRQRSDWIVQNQVVRDFRFALHVGDVVNWDTSDHSMYVSAAKNLLPLQAAMPWVSAIGNHDTAAVCPGGGACPGQNTRVTVRNTDTFNTYFPESKFTGLAGQFEAGKVDNAFSIFRAGGVSWLVLNLELWPRKAAVSWAAKVVADHPRHNVIIVTHAYLSSKGGLSSSSGYGETSPRYLFDNLVKRYENIKLVVSGHTGTAATRIDKGKAGNRIVSLLQAFHSNTTNPLRLVEFDIKKSTLRTFIYAPNTNWKPKKYIQTIKKIHYIK